MDLGDKTSRYCLIDSNGEVAKEGSVATTKKGMNQVFGAMRRCRIAIEVDGGFAGGVTGDADAAAGAGGVFDGKDQSL